MEDFGGGGNDKGISTPEYGLWLHPVGQEDAASHPVRYGLHGTNQYEPVLWNLREVGVLRRL